ncbi:MAG TPA: tetratricopeptide repeat protein [Spirochaetota bacterium]|nr:tetratricopeptide repeat protein [Spirochaetota bacterium]HRT74806.1 tetratricopeptide repeat protein [Spirochaetota bacterium]
MKHYEDIEADDCYDMAVEWIRHGNYDKAVHYFSRAIELNQYFIYAYIALARAYATQKKFTDAVHVLKKAVRLDPAFDRLHYLMAKYAHKNGDYKNALICISRAIEMDDKDLYREAREIIEANYRRR